MEVFTRLTKNGKEVIIDGKMADYSEYLDVKNCINEILDESKILKIYFINANTISPYILGYILKLHENDNINISIIVSNAILYEFLQSIDFHKFFDIKIKEYNK